MTDAFDIPDDAPFDEAVVKEAEAKLAQLGKDMTADKMAEAALLQQSMMDGGPSSVSEAFRNLMSYCNVGIRRMAERIGVRRKLLQKMLDGEAPMPPDVMAKMENVFRSIKPDLFK